MIRKACELKHLRLFKRSLERAPGIPLVPS